MEVEVIVMVMVVVMVIVTVTVSPVPVVVAVTVAVAADVLSSSVLPQPCKDREAMKPKQMAANARASFMIAKIDDVKYCQKQMRGSLFTSAGKATARIVKSRTKSECGWMLSDWQQVSPVSCLVVVSD